MASSPRVTNWAYNRPIERLFLEIVMVKAADSSSELSTIRFVRLPIQSHSV